MRVNIYTLSNKQTIKTFSSRENLKNWLKSIPFYFIDTDEEIDQYKVVDIELIDEEYDSLIQRKII